MIQFYVHIDSLTPTEPAKFRYTHYNLDGTPFLYDPEEQPFIKYNKEYVECNCFLEDIRKNGIKYALVVDIHGRILDGNCRYWCAKILGIEYLPINIEHLIGTDKSFYPKKLVIGRASS